MFHLNGVHDVKYESGSQAFHFNFSDTIFM